MSKHHVTARVPEDVYEALEDVREAEQIRSTAIARLLGRGIEAWRVDTAVSRYRDDESDLTADFAALDAE